MIALARLLHEHRRAVERELLCHHWHMSDVGKSLSLNEFASLLLAATPDSAIGVVRTEGWSLTDHLLANLCEIQSGLIGLKSRLTRPGVDYDEVPEDLPDGERSFNDVRLESMTVDELKAKRDKHLEMVD